MKSYRELSGISDFMERFKYLKLNGAVGAETFGYDRYLNQMFYKLPEWRKARRKAMLRDNDGDYVCDMGFPGRAIVGNVLVHHINPITIDDILDRNPKLFDLDNLICVSHSTHEAIHYGDEGLLPQDPIVRSQNDTCPWRISK